MLDSNILDFSEREIDPVNFKHDHSYALNNEIHSLNENNVTTETNKFSLPTSDHIILDSDLEPENSDSESEYIGTRLRKIQEERQKLLDKIRTHNDGKLFQ